MKPDRRIADASMRPGLNRPGNTGTASLEKLDRSQARFNEARAESPGKSEVEEDRSVAGASMRPGLNRPGNIRGRLKPTGEASMRPGLNRPGNNARPDRPRFNEARAGTGKCRHHASMRPGLNRPGNTPCPKCLSNPCLRRHLRELPQIGLAVLDSGFPDLGCQTANSMRERR